MSEDLNVLCFSPVLIIELSDVQPPMESTPTPPTPPNPPHEKAFNSRVSHINENTSSTQQSIIVTGCDTLWSSRRWSLTWAQQGVPDSLGYPGTIRAQCQGKKEKRKRKSSRAESCVQACVHCRCSEKCCCVRPVVERFLNTGKHELSILRNPLDLFTLQQHATHSESALITLPDTLGCDILGN